MKSVVAQVPVSEQFCLSCAAPWSSAFQKHSHFERGLSGNKVYQRQKYLQLLSALQKAEQKGRLS